MPKPETGRFAFTLGAGALMSHGLNSLHSWWLFKANAANIKITSDDPHMTLSSLQNSYVMSGILCLLLSALLIMAYLDTFGHKEPGEP